jgi:hypothetical protein
MLSEALAYVDLLVLVAARRFAGFSVSTFSLATVEYRCLAGGSHPSASMIIITFKMRRNVAYCSNRADVHTWYALHAVDWMDEA